MSKQTLLEKKDTIIDDIIDDLKENIYESNNYILDLVREALRRRTLGDLKDIAYPDSNN